MENFVSVVFVLKKLGDRMSPKTIPFPVTTMKTYPRTAAFAGMREG